MKAFGLLLALTSLGLVTSPVMAGEAAKAAKAAKADAARAEKRAKIDAMAKTTLDDLFARSPPAKALFAKAAGHAVFDNTKVALGISGGGGQGVAVVGRDGDRTYMKMGTGGVGFGLGAQNYQVVFLFETRQALDGFVEKGWQADASAQAAAGSAGANAEATFRNGVAVWQITDKGLMASADIAGTKYWKNDKLN